MAIQTAGQVVQVCNGHTCRIQSMTSNTEIAATRVFIEPKYAGSKFLIEVDLPTNSSDDSDAQGGNANPYWGLTVQRSVNGGAFTNCPYLGTDTTGHINVHMEISPWRAGTDDGAGAWNQGRRYRMKPTSTMIIDNPSYSSGDNIVYRLYGTVKSGPRYMQLGAPHGFGADDNYFNFHYGMIVHEITT